MSLRRFVAYFFAVSAVSTVAFASSLMGQAPPPESAQSAGVNAGMDAAAPDQANRLYRAMQGRPRHKPAAKTAQVALAQ